MNLKKGRKSSRQTHAKVNLTQRAAPNGVKGLGHGTWEGSSA